MLARSGQALLLSAVVLASAPAITVVIPSRLTPDEFGLLAERLQQSSSYKVRIQAALLLGSAGGSAAFPVLVQALKSDPVGSARAAAALALGEVGDDRAYSPLVEALSEPDAFVRTQIGKALVTLSSRPEGGLRLWAASRGAPESTRLLCAHLLASLGADGVPALLEAASDPSTAISAAAKDELVRLPPQQLEGGLRAALGLHDARASALAATMLGDRLDRGAVPLLADAAVDPRQPTEVVLAARSALQRLSDAISLEIEGRRYQSPVARDRQRALVLITAKGGDEAQDLLIEALDDEDPMVLSEAVHGLAEVGDADALPALRALQGRPQPLAGAVQEAVRRIERAHLTRSELR
jgi:HEAT repeat protein